MGEVNRYAQGEFCWVELATTDLEAASAYYTTLFGWTVEDRPGGEQGLYRVCRVEGRDVAGLYEMNADESSSMPPRWKSYFAVDDVDRVTKKAQSLGAEIISEPFDVMDAGRMAMIRDPSGAVAGLWQGADTIGAQLVNEPGSISWVELQTRDVAAAGEFFRGLFGWEAETTDYGEGTFYTTFKDGDAYRAGMIAVPESAGDTYSAWLPYLEIDDVDAVITRSEDLGGTTMVPAQSVPEVGRWAVARDLQGATFAVITSATPSET
jgi:uncharacterized protein